MKYVFVFLVMAACSLSIAARPNYPAIRILFLYVGVSFAALSGLYLARPRLTLLKRPDGRLSVLGWVLFLPYFAMTWLVYLLKTTCWRKPSAQRVAENVYLGRWHSRFERAALEKHGIRAILDLTWEFGESRRLTDGRAYANLPTLDATAPTDEQLKHGVAWIAEASRRGPVLVHCALGHGRSAAMVVAYLAGQGLARDVRAALAEVQRVRPAVRLNAEQRAAVERFARGLKRS